MSKEQNAIVRRSIRHDVSIRGAISVLGDHGALVRLAGGSGARDGWVNVDLVDFSSSGMGMISMVFVPRRTLLTIRLFGPEPEAPVILEAPVRVQRVCMTDPRPGYHVGTSFADPSQESIAQINALLEQLAGNEEKVARGSR